MKKIKIVSAILLLACGLTIIVYFCLNINCFQAKELVEAIRNNDVDSVDKIVKLNPECVNVLPQTQIEQILCFVCQGTEAEYPLTEACRYHNFQIIQRLIGAGADVNLHTHMNTALSLTYECKADNWYSVSQYLISNGADLDYEISYGGVLEDIVIRGYDCTEEEEEMVLNAFLYALENCDHSKVDWYQVLRKSAVYDRIQIVEFLLENGYCDVNASFSGYTVLMSAAKEGSPKTIQLLLNNGADKSLVDFSGKTAYDYAVEYGKEDNAELLK